MVYFGGLGLGLGFVLRLGLAVGYYRADSGPCINCSHPLSMQVSE